MKTRRRIRNRGSIEQLPNGRWRCRIKGRTPDGRKFSLGKADYKTREDAERALEGFRRQAMDLESGLSQLEEHTTLAAYKDRALKMRPSDARKSLVWSRRDASTWRYLRPLWNIPMTALDAGRLQGWVEHLRREGYAENTIDSAVTLMRRVIGHACATKALARLPWGDARLALVSRADCGKGDLLEPDEWERVRDAARVIDAEKKGGPLSDLWLRLSFLRVVACRPVELAQLGPDHLCASINGPMIEIPLNVIAKRGDPGQRVIGVELADALAAHFAAMSESAQKLRLYFPYRGRSGRWRPRFTVDSEGYRVGRDVIVRGEIERLRSLSGVLDFNPYSLRHTRLDELAHNEGPVFAQNQGGHRSYRTTQRYVHSSARHLTPGCFDVAGILGVEPSSRPPEGGGRSKKKKQGRFMVHDGGAAPAAAEGDLRAPVAEQLALESVAATDVRQAHDDVPRSQPARSGPPAQSSRGPREGFDQDDVDGAARYVAAIRAHGLDAVVEHVTAQLGPEAVLVASDVAFFSLSPLCPEDDRGTLRSFAGRLRAHALWSLRMSEGKTPSEIDCFLNGTG